MQETPSPSNQPTQEDPGVTLRADHPVGVHFSFEHPQSRVGISASILSHIAMGVIAFLVMRYTPEALTLEIIPDQVPKDVVWLTTPGPGGGGGGGGNKAPDPPKKAELPVPVPVRKEPTPIPKEPPPLEDLNIPAKTITPAELPLPGALQSENVSTASQGAGTLGGGGTGSGSGIGPGQGSGLGPGHGGGIGGGAYRPGSGVTIPQLVREVKPHYTADAMRAKVQGAVWLECIVMPDGTVGDIKIIKSLDSVFGLDQEAIKAARQWRFIPGTRQGQPVPVIIMIELSFTLR